LDINIFPVRAHFGLEAPRLGERYTGAFGAGSDVLRQPRAMGLKLEKRKKKKKKKNLAKNKGMARHVAYLERLEEMFAGGIPLVVVEYGMRRKIRESVVGIGLMIKKNAGPRWGAGGSSPMRSRGYSGHPHRCHVALGTVK
jgi:hypothetical protein